jgi:hypothetical protein
MDNVKRRVSAHATELPMKVDSLQDFEDPRAAYKTASANTENW